MRSQLLARRAYRLPLPARSNCNVPVLILEHSAAPPGSLNSPHITHRLRLGLIVSTQLRGVIGVAKADVGLTMSLTVITRLRLWVEFTYLLHMPSISYQPG